MVKFKGVGLLTAISDLLLRSEKLPSRLIVKLSSLSILFEIKLVWKLFTDAAVSSEQF